VIYVFVRCMKWIKVHAASGSNGLKIKPRIDLINL